MSKSRIAAKVAQNAPNQQNSASTIFAQKHSDIKLAIIIYQKKIKRATKHATNYVWTQDNVYRA